MLLIALTAVIAFLISGLFGYVVHRSLHQSWTGKLNQKHMTHHLKLYPPTDYLSETYRQAGNDNTTRIFAIAALPLVAAPILLGIFGILPITLVITVIIVMGIMGFLHDYLHDAFHISHHQLTKVPVVKSIFAYWVKLHYQHHVNMKSNYGIFLFHWDKLFRTFKIN